MKPRGTFQRALTTRSLALKIYQTDLGQFPRREGLFLVSMLSDFDCVN